MVIKSKKPKKRPLPNIEKGDVVSFYQGRKARLTVTDVRMFEGVKMAAFVVDGVEHTAPFAKLEIVTKAPPAAKVLDEKGAS